MSVLKDSRIPMSWPLAYIGVSKDFISPTEAMEEICEGANDEGSVKMIEDYYSEAGEAKEDFLKFVNRKFHFNQNEIDISNFIWGIGYLNQVYNANLTKQEKLSEIAKIWAKFHYPPTWKAFIYYMPVRDDQDSGIDDVYGRFSNFIELEVRKLVGAQKHH
ncbi:DUF2247 family protein [Parapedobacter sp. 10938]|uniref:DUF2247 family protein n=1 Tax=Parapedobacter flavus TaxID=3110225 RepID=UPI002DBB43AC|nr:DUF2247 family protein [Parapedobacter sp. 10938]MEC3882014.1 DUF2247 family protein [Parapedobacter sp. 10938]